MSETRTTVPTIRRAHGSDGVPVVLLPGLFGGEWIWTDTATSLLAQGFDVVTLPAALAEVPDGRGANLEGLRGLVDAALDAVPADTVHVCGNSLGGLLALDVAARSPERVRSVVVSGAPGLGHVALELSSERPVADALADTLAAHLFHDPARARPEQVRFARGLLERDETKLNVLRALRAARRVDVPTLLRRVSRPVLLLWGEHDAITPVQPWLAVLHELPDAELALVPDCGHTPMLERPAAFNERLLAFLRRQGHGSPAGATAPA